MKYKVYLGIGHGGADPGAMANGFKEAALCLEIGKACGEELKRHGVEVMLSRESDSTESLSAKIKECNSYSPHLCADIHINAGGGDGAEVFYSVLGGKGAAMAKNILGEISALGQNSRGAKTKTRADGKDYFGFIRETKAPAVILECAFIDRREDLAIIDTAQERKIFGIAIAKGILKTLGISYRKSAYKDEEKIPSWAKKGVEYMTEKGYMQGSNGYFNPNAPMTRAEIATLLYRMK